MAFEIDHDRRRAHFRAEPGFSGTVLSQAIADMFDADPKTASYDFVIDVRESDTGAQPSDIQIVAAAYHRHKRAPGLKYGCFVSLDPNYPFWAAAMDDIFGDRKNRVFVTPERAIAFLDEVRGKAAA
jgi:hypothetical protein